MTSPLNTLLHAAETRPNRTAFIAGDRIWNYRHFVADVERTARAFAARGVGAGDRVALHMANVPEMAIALYACFRLGAIAAALNNRFKTPELQALLERLRPALYVGQDRLYPFAAPVEPQILPMTARFIVGSAAPGDGARPWQALLSHDDAALAGPPHPDVNAPALLLTTSGTTGVPKLVAHSAATLAASMASNYRPDDIVIGSTPMVHASGIHVFLSTIHYGATLVLLERFDPDTMLDTIEGHRGTLLLGLPFMYREILDRQRARPRDITSLRFCLSGGDICSAELQSEFPYVFGRPLHSSWAMTEIAAAMLPGRRPGPTCVVAQGTEVRIVDDNGEPAPHGTAGEMLIRAPGLAIGYWTGPGRVEGFGADGWLATGDIMRRGDGNELWFLGRKTDLIVRGGSNIAPAEVEQVLRTHPAVREVAVLGAPDPVLGQRVVALVELAVDADEAVLDAILANARPQLADYKLPERLKVVREIPKNALGKIERKTLPFLLDA